MDWFNQLVRWYVGKCNEREGQYPVELVLNPRRIGLGGSWAGKNIVVTIKAVDVVKADADTATRTKVIGLGQWQMTNTK